MQRILFLLMVTLAVGVRAQEVRLKPGSAAIISPAMETTVTCEVATAKNQCFCDYEYGHYDVLYLSLITPNGAKVHLRPFDYHGTLPDCEKMLAAEPRCR